MRSPFPAGLSPRRRLLFGGLAALVAVAVLVAVGLAVGAGGDRDAAVDPDRPGRVLLIPGYGGGRDALEVLAGRLRDTGRDARVLTLAGDGTGDLLTQVAVLGDAVSAATDDGAPSVDLVGYSAGGVVARLWADRADAHTRRVVTLGAPIHGTDLAAFGNALAPDVCPAACRQLQPGSALLAPLAEKPVPLPWVSVWSSTDQTVTPPESARTAGATNVVLQDLCPGRAVAHGALPTDPVATRVVLGALGVAPPAAPAPGC